jgi:cytochrome bd-type quinol oxidase subunit 2
MRRFNWPLWAGFLLTLIAAFSYFAFFVNFPVTRDFPWANLLLFLLAAVLIVMGIRRAFARDRAHPTRSKVVASIVTTLSVLVCAFFIFAIFIAGRFLPPSTGAPHVGQKVPEFTLSDANSRQVSLNQLTSEPVDGKAPKGVLLVFYRGWW